MTIPRPDIGLVNCAACNQTLIGERTAGKVLSGAVLALVTNPPAVAGRVAGRPYCGACLGEVTR